MEHDSREVDNAFEFIAYENNDLMDCDNDAALVNQPWQPEEISDFSSSDAESSVNNFSQHDTTYDESDSLCGSPSSSVNSEGASCMDIQHCSDDDDNPDLYEDSDIRANQALLDILKVYIEERWTKASLDKSIKLCKRMLPQPNALPSSAWTALNKLQKLTGTYSSTLHRFCVQCKGFVTCGCTDSVTSFYSFSLEDQIKHMFEQRNLAIIID